MIKKRIKRPPPPYTGWRAFRAVKREQLARLEEAYCQFAFGCGYVPTYPKHTDAISRALIELRRAMSVEKWGK